MISSFTWSYKIIFLTRNKGSSKTYIIRFRRVEFSLTGYSTVVCLLCSFFPNILRHDPIISHFSSVAIYFLSCNYQNLVCRVELNFTVEFTFSLNLIHLIILQFLVFSKKILMFHIANCIFFSLSFPLKWKVPCTGHGEPYHSPPDRHSNPFVPILWFHRAGCSFLRSHAISAFSV